MSSSAVTALRSSWTLLVPAALIVAVAALRQRYLRWGATDEETITPLPGDELLGDVDVTTTRGITIKADAATVWPWIAQLGQGRGGFYSYDALENLVGADIHNADQVVPAWQSVHVGDPFRLHPDVVLAVALVDPERALVVRGGVPLGRVAAPYEFTWAFVLRPRADGTTRLVVRERYSYSKRWAGLIVQPAQLVSCLMSPRMLRGIAQRSEDAAQREHDLSEAVAPASPAHHHAPPTHRCDDRPRRPGRRDRLRTARRGTPPDPGVV
jgi:hypothetical protein